MSYAVVLTMSAFDLIFAGLGVMRVWVDPAIAQA